MSSQLPQNALSLSSSHADSNGIPLFKSNNLFIINNVSKFCQTLNGKPWKKKKIKIHDYEFKLHLFPNGLTQINHGFVQYFVELTKMPTNVSRIVAFVHLFCVETATAYKETKIWKEIGDSSGFVWSLALKQCTNYTALHFGVGIEILQPISHCNKVNRCMDTIELYPIIEYEWRWNHIKSILNTLKTSNHNMSSYSDNTENDMFCFGIESIPISIDKMDKNIIIFCNLLKLPPNIHEITIVFKVKMCHPEYCNTFTLNYESTRCILKLIKEDIEWLLSTDHRDLSLQFRIEIIETSCILHNDTNLQFMQCWRSMNDALNTYYKENKKQLKNTFLDYIYGIAVHDCLVLSIVNHGNMDNQENRKWELLHFDDAFPILEEITFVNMTQKEQFISYILQYCYQHKTPPNRKKMKKMAKNIKRNDTEFVEMNRIRLDLEKEEKKLIESENIIKQKRKQMEAKQCKIMEKERRIKESMKLLDKMKKDIQKEQRNVHCLSKTLKKTRKKWILKQKEYETEMEEKRKRDKCSAEQRKKNRSMMKSEIVKRKTIQCKIKQELREYIDNWNTIHTHEMGQINTECKIECGNTTVTQQSEYEMETTHTRRIKQNFIRFKLNKELEEYFIAQNEVNQDIDNIDSIDILQLSIDALLCDDNVITNILDDVISIEDADIMSNVNQPFIPSYSAPIYDGNHVCLDRNEENVVMVGINDSNDAKDMEQDTKDGSLLYDESPNDHYEFNILSRNAERTLVEFRLKMQFEVLQKEVIHWMMHRRNKDTLDDRITECLKFTIEWLHITGDMYYELQCIYDGKPYSKPYVNYWYEVYLSHNVKLYEIMQDIELSVLNVIDAVFFFQEHPNHSNVLLIQMESMDIETQLQLQRLLFLITIVDVFESMRDKFRQLYINGEWHETEFEKTECEYEYDQMSYEYSSESEFESQNMYPQETQQVELERRSHLIACNSSDTYRYIQPLKTQDTFTIHNENMTVFCNTKLGEKMSKKKVSLGPFLFKIYLYPNGFSKDKDRFVEYKIKLSECNDSDIDSVVVYFRLYEIETNTEYRNTKVFDSKHSSYTWCRTLLTLQKCSQHKHLQFGYEIEILQTHRRRQDEGIRDHACAYPNLSDNGEYKKFWEIEKLMLSSIKYCKYPALFYSEIYSDTFCVSLRSVTISKTKKNINISLHLFKLPPMVERLEATFQISTNIKRANIKCSKQHIFDYKKTECIITLSKKQSEALLVSHLSQLLQITYTVRFNRVWYRDYMDTPHKIRYYKSTNINYTLTRCKTKKSSKQRKNMKYRGNRHKRRKKKKQRKRVTQKSHKHSSFGQSVELKENGYIEYGEYNNYGHQMSGERYEHYESL